MPPDQLSTTPIAAAMLYRQGVRLLVAGRAADAIRLLQAAVCIDDQFAIALAALAVAHAELSDDGADEERWRPLIERAGRQREISRREREHVAVIALTLEGRLARASALGREHLQEFPTDQPVMHVLTSRGADLDDLVTTVQNPGY